ncbi:hypothetical protein KLP40_12810 [Hymenobacter sp. NST-14]|uniref:hypothetical protein n=1 Tax=Hymenobacter piscis TaxID=2839984 RepID=UPI001C02599C|nr:hypothetical protein [Hymenobacter piscis]MBT9394046.1 hypothetical protein [Hymenobacter piscis]
MIPDDMPGWLVLLIAILVFVTGIILWIQAQTDYQKHRPEQETMPDWSRQSRQSRLPRQFMNAVGTILLALYLLVAAWHRL